MLSVLPPAVAATYTEAALPARMRPPLQVLVLNTTQPLPPPRIGGDRREWIKLLRRMDAIGMIGWTARPKAICGAFTVAKDGVSDRFICDARHANRLFTDSPAVQLPNPSHLVQMQLPPGVMMFSGKSDLSDYYHHMGLPPHLRPFFAFPALTQAELAELGRPPDEPHPMCMCLPMGWLDSVYVGQAVHEHLVYATTPLQREHNLLHMASPVLTHDSALHSIIIDDFFIFSLSQSLAQQQLDAVLDCYARAGFVVKRRKVVQPTSAPVKIIGFDVHGAAGTISLPLDSQATLVAATRAVLQAPTVTGRQLSHIVGRWTWVMLLRRCTLSVLQHAYRYCRLAQCRRFTLWPSVRRELYMLLTLLPLMQFKLSAPCFRRAFASDASELAGGVVSTPLTPALQQQLWPLCSSKHQALLQTLLNADRARMVPASSVGGLSPDARMAASSLSAARAAAPIFDAFYAAVAAAEWRTDISSAWARPAHINALELHAALLAVHRLLSYPSSLMSRAYLLLDSTTVFFTLWKGRSSSPALLLILRRMAALQLAAGLTLMPGWVPSAVNPADAPSRLVAQHCPQGRALAA